MANSTAQTNQNSGQNSQANSKGKNKMLIYIGLLIVAVIIIGFLFLGTIGTGSPALISQPESNATPIYLSIPQAQSLLNSTIVNYTANYTATSIYNSTFPYNITLLEGIVPELAGNVTNGWVTLAFGSGANNASVLYTVMQTYNASQISAFFAQAISSSYTTLPSMSTGVSNGMNYTYESHTNRTGTYQALIGYKDGYVSLVQIEANSEPVNQSQMAQVVSSNMP